MYIFNQLFYIYIFYINSIIIYIILLSFQNKFIVLLMQKHIKVKNVLVLR